MAKQLHSLRERAEDTPAENPDQETPGIRVLFDETALQTFIYLILPDPSNGDRNIRQGYEIPNKITWETETLCHQLFFDMESAAGRLGDKDNPPNASEIRAYEFVAAMTRFGLDRGDLFDALVNAQNKIIEQIHQETQRRAAEYTTEPVNVPIKGPEDQDEPIAVNFDLVKQPRGGDMIRIKNNGVLEIPIDIDGEPGYIRPGQSVFTFSIQVSGSGITCMGLIFETQESTPFDIARETQVLFPGPHDGLVIASTESELYQE